jgi:hypothetical protein
MGAAGRSIEAPEWIGKLRQNAEKREGSGKVFAHEDGVVPSLGGGKSMSWTGTNLNGHGDEEEAELSKVLGLNQTRVDIEPLASPPLATTVGQSFIGDPIAPAGQGDMDWSYIMNEYNVAEYSAFGSFGFPAQDFMPGTQSNTGGFPGGS